MIRHEETFMSNLALSVLGLISMDWPPLRHLGCGVYPIISLEQHFS